MSITKAGLRLLKDEREEETAKKDEPRRCPLCGATRYNLPAHLRTEHGWR